MEHCQKCVYFKNGRLKSLCYKCRNLRRLTYHRSVLPKYTNESDIVPPALGCFYNQEQE